MFKKTVAGICNSFVSQLVTVRDNQAAEAEKQSGIIAEAQDQREVANAEYNAADSAISNIRVLFGQEESVAIPE